MKKVILKYVGLALVLAFSTNQAFAQKGLGTQQPDKSSALDIVSEKRGLLIPRLELTQTTVAAPVTAPANSLLVYNTAEVNDVTPGFYYWETNKWVRIASTSTEKTVTVTAGENVAVSETVTGGTTDYKVSVKGGLGNGQVLVTKIVGGVTTTEWVNPDMFVNNAITADNGLTYVPSPLPGGQDEIKLGGPLSSVTEITTTNTETLAITGLQDVSTGFDGNFQDIVIMGADGVLKVTSAKSMVEDAIANGNLNAKTLQGDGITVTAGGVVGTDLSVANSLLKDVTLGIADGAITNTKLGAGAVSTDKIASVGPDQVLTTDLNGVPVWVNQATLVPTITNTLENKVGSNGNTIISTVNGIAAEIDLIKNVSNTIAGTNLVTSVNGVESTTLDLSGAIQAGQTTTTVVDGINTTVLSTTAGNNIAYEVNVSSQAIQDNQLKTVVESGTGITVVPNPIGNTITYTVAADLSAITLSGDVIGTANATKVEKIQGTAVSTINPTTTGQILVYNSVSEEWVPGMPILDADDITNAKDLGNTDGSILVTDGAGATLVNTNIEVADGGITTVKLDDGAVTAPKLSAGAGDDGRIGVADDQGNITYQNIGDIVDVQASQLTTTVVGGDDVIVTPTITDNNTEYLVEVKAAMPKFFYMPAVIFDTSVNGTFTRNLHSEYQAQFTGTGNPTLVSSAGAANAIPTLSANELEYHITYYDTTVFANLSINAMGILTYDIIGDATEASYMTIIFVVK